jgi:hypothetical protein
MKLINVIPALLILLLSCSNESKMTNEIKKIHFKRSNINLSDSLDFRFVVLETNNDCLIGYIDRIEIFDNRIFIHDLYLSKSIFVFDINGHFITQVGSKGGGPESYIVPYGFEIDREKRRLIVNDADRNRLVFYDLDTYKYIMYKECPFNYLNLSVLKNRFYFFSPFGFDKSRNDNYILVTDSLFTPVFKDWKCNFRAYRSLTVSNKNIYSVNDQVFAYHHLQPYIYEITDRNCKIHTLLSIEGFVFPALDSSVDPTSFQYMDELEKSQKKISAYGIYESNDILFVQMIIGKQPYFAIYNKRTNVSSVFSGRDFVNSAGLDAAIFPQGATDEEIIGMITAGQKINKEKIKNSAFAEIVDNIKDDDNPIVCFFKWK